MRPFFVDDAKVTIMGLNDEGALSLVGFPVFFSSEF